MILTPDGQRWLDMFEMTKMAVDNLSWLAGLYEGEGCLVRKVDRRNGHVSWELSISSTDEDVIRRAHQTMDVGNVTFIKRQNERWQDKYRWRVGKRDEIALVISLIRPLLGERRGARADEFTAWWIRERVF